MTYKNQNKKNTRLVKILHPAMWKINNELFFYYYFVSLSKMICYVGIHFVRLIFNDDKKKNLCWRIYVDNAPICYFFFLKLQREKIFKLSRYTHSIEDYKKTSIFSISKRTKKKEEMYWSFLTAHYIKFNTNGTLDGTNKNGCF